MQQPGGQEAKRQVTKMSGLYGEEPLGEGQPRPRAREFRVGVRVCQPYPVTEGCWGNLVVRSALIY